MYLKIISQSTPSTLQYILPVVGCVVACCSTLILAKSPANCGAHLAESLFQTLSGMYQKNIFAIRTPYFVVYIPEFGCHSSLRQPHPHPGQSPTNCDVHLVESFFNMLWKYRKNRKSIKHNKLLLQKQKNFGIILYNLEAFYSALKAYLYLYFN